MSVSSCTIYHNTHRFGLGDFRGKVIGRSLLFHGQKAMLLLFVVLVVTPAQEEKRRPKTGEV
jgi:hypothetical protein